jgi:dye decolorizing peroxidase
MTGGSEHLPQKRGPNRRTVLGGGLLGLAAAGAGAGLVSRDHEPAPSAARADLPGDLAYSFYGKRQRGVVEPPQPWSTLVALDLREGADRSDVQRLMRIWTDDIARLMSGEAPLTDQEPELAARTAGLTVTVGWGPGLFEKAGLHDPRPSWAAALPPFDHDDLDPAYTGGDLALQISAHSPVTVAHARRQLTTGAASLTVPRWVQQGYREPMERHGWSMRNLFGQVDGTVQPDPTARDPSLVWIDAEGPPGWQNGTSMVVRRIAMDLDAWDQADRTAREHAVGRRLSDGAPVTGGRVESDVDLRATTDSGLPVVNPDAHVARAASRNVREQFLRRPYSYSDAGPGGQVDSGLVFVAYQADPVRQFVPVQRRLDEADLLNLWTRAVGSAVFAVPPGCEPGQYLGQALLA